MKTPISNLQEIKTTIIGSALFIVSIAWFAVNFESLNEFKLEDIYVPSIIGGVGILFLLAPDKFLNYVFGRMKSKPENKEGK